MRLLRIFACFAFVWFPSAPFAATSASQHQNAPKTTKTKKEPPPQGKENHQHQFVGIVLLPTYCLNSQTSSPQPLSVAPCPANALSFPPNSSEIVSILGN